MSTCWESVRTAVCLAAVAVLVGCQSLVDVATGPAEPDGVAADVATLLQQGRLVDAEAAGLAAVAVSKSGPDALARRAIELAALMRAYGQLQGAQRVLDQALSLVERDQSASADALCSLLFDLASISYDRGHTAAATSLAERMQAVAAARLGEGSPSYVRSLQLAGALLNRQQREAEALPILDRALVVSVATAGEASELTADVLVELSRAQRGSDLRQAEATALRALSIRERKLGSRHDDVAEATALLAGIALRGDQHDKALAWYRRTLDIREAVNGANHPSVASTLLNISDLLGTLSRFDEADQNYRRAAAIYSTIYGEYSTTLAEVLERQANLQRRAGKHDQAEPMMLRALDIRLRVGPESDLVRSYTVLSAIYLTQGRYRDAEAVLLRGREIAEQRLEPANRDRLTTLENLGVTYLALGRYRDAEPLLQQGLSIREATLGAQHRTVFNVLNNLAGLYQEIERPDLAEPLFRRMLANAEKTFGPGHLDTARALTGVAVTLNAQRRPAEAEPMLRRALVIQGQQLPAGHRDINWTRLHLGQSLRAQARQEEGVLVVVDLLQAQELALGPEHPEVARTLSLLAQLYADLGRIDEQEAALERALRIRTKTMGAQHPDVATSLERLAEVARARGRADPALDLARQATSIRRARFLGAGALGDGGAISPTVELRARRAAFENHLRLLEPQIAAAPTAPRQALLNEGLAVVQLARASDTAAVVLQVAARFTAADDALATLLRQRQDLLLRRKSTEAELIRALGRPQALRDEAALAALRRTMAEVEARLAALADELGQRFPEYQQLIDKPIADLAELQRTLQPREALLSYFVMDEASYAWVVRRDSAHLQRLTPGRAQLAASIARLRATLGVSADGALPSFDDEIAYRLYSELLQPLQPALRGARHLIVVSDGPLQGLPLSLLVTRPSEKGTPSPEVQWLVRRYAFSELPAESALIALRRLRPSAAARESFAGFGAPEFKGTPGAARGAVALFSSRGLADVSQIAALPPLPDSASEVLSIARALGSTEGVFLGKAASERRVKQMELARYRTIMFATHGLVAGELRGLAEPALALTPPPTPTEEDDGLLTASEVALLRMNADWVILSACSTAAADGTPGAEALSGLAKAFVYAGARALLVSHWPVDSRAAARLTTGTIGRLAAAPDIGKAEALRRTMLELSGQRGTSHPAFWAPFALVGID